MNIKRLTLATLLVLGILISSGSAWSVNRALLIGVADYLDDNIPDLPGNKLDTRIMKDIVQQLGFAENEIRVLTDRDAGLANIKHEIETWLINGTGSEDRVIIYFSGHGTQIKDVSNDEQDGKDEALVPYDAVFGRDDSLMNDDEFNSLLNRIPAEETFVFVDTCHSGTATKGISPDDGYKVKFVSWPGVGDTSRGRPKAKPDNSRSVYVALSACRDDEEAISGRKGSLFTLGLKRAVDESRNKELTLLDAKKVSTGFIVEEFEKRQELIHNPVVSGNQSLASKNLFIQASIPGPLPGLSKRQSNLWNDMVKLAQRADYQLQINIDKQSYAIGDDIKISVEVTKSGYLNIVNVGAKDEIATVLFPNRFEQNNYINSGKTIQLPGDGEKFTLKARPPASETLIVVFHTEKPLNLWRDGIQNASSIFSDLSSKEMRSFVAETAHSKSSGASVGSGILITEITNE